MPNTYFKLYVQTVFAVKHRNALLKQPWRSKMQGVIGSLINEAGAHTIIVNGVEDHVHCLFSMKPGQSISGLMQTAKAKSSKWFNEQHFIADRFAWQDGFGSFSYGQSQVPAVYRYIEGQEAHHKGQAFLDEYVQMLKAFEIEYDERFLFHPPL